MRCRHVFSALTLSAALALAVSSPATGAAAQNGTVAGAGGTSAAPNTGLAKFSAAFVISQANPDRSPPGANDWTCTPGVAHPRPVVLVHGTWENAYANWAGLSPVLKEAGYCVYALNFGAPQGDVFKGRAAIPASSGEVAAFVDRVLAATGAGEVDLVGHSQGGGLLPRWYLKFDGGAAKTHRLVGIAPSNHGTTALGMATLAKSLLLLDATARMTGQAAKDQTVGSEVNTRLDEGGDTMPGVRYTTIVTRTDEVVTPYRQQYLTAGPGAPVDNVTVQDACPLELSGHVGITHSTIMYRLVLNALDPQHALPATCLS